MAERTSYTSFPPIISIYLFLICLPPVQITAQSCKMEVNVIPKCIASTLNPHLRRVLKHTLKSEIIPSIDVSLTLERTWTSWINKVSQCSRNTLLHIQLMTWNVCSFVPLLNIVPIIHKPYYCLMKFFNHLFNLFIMYCC